MGSEAGRHDLPQTKSPPTRNRQTTFGRQFNIESHRPLSMSNTSNDIGDRDIAKPLLFSISREESS